MIGLLGRKKGMTAIYGDNGKQIPVTVIEAGPCPVIQVKNEKTDGYEALQLGFDPIKSKSLTKPQLGHLAKHNTAPHRLLSEFRNFDGDSKTGDVLKVDLFKPGDIVEVTGISKGRGFAGVVKRHGFHMPVQSHGTHESYRGTGSIGNASSPSRVWPGKKMPGRMGGINVTVKNLRVIRVDVEHDLIVVKGAVPGATGGYLHIRKR